ncbi:MAG: hypothetical protein HQL18_02700, partial [Candidatus Omnitrophica bacterium]|nr:hypothetical protein [Candidatus Omnitrophota bacterium]
MFDEGKLRRHVRVCHDLPVHWKIPATGVEGNGILRNLSVFGALLESRMASRSGKHAEVIL